MLNGIDRAFLLTVDLILVVMALSCNLTTFRTILRRFIILPYYILVPSTIGEHRTKVPIVCEHYSCIEYCLLNI